MQLVDSHCHLYLEQFNEDRDEVIHRAMEAGVEAFFLPNIDSETIDSMNALAQKYPSNCFPMMGLHPTSVKENFKEELAIVKRELSTGKYCAVGEIGIDLYWDKAHQQEQVRAFEQQIAWAKEMKLPIVIHARDSFNEIFEVVDRMNDEHLTGVFHCFTGNLDQAKKIMGYGGFKMGIGGVLTFKNGGLDKFIAEIPIEYLILETDAPYLAPSPYRGKRNESAYLKEILTKLSGLYDLKEDEVASITSSNALELFNMK